MSIFYHNHSRQNTLEVSRFCLDTSILGEIQEHFEV